MDIAPVQPPAVPTTSISVTASIPAFAPSIYTPVISPISSQISVNIYLSPPRASLEQLQQPGPQPTLPKRLSPDRPEILIQAYLAEKAAWLAQHPTVRPAEYRKARKWKTPRPKVLKEQAFYMPRERRDLTGSIIAEKANWTNEEIIVWLDNDKRKEEEEYNRLESEFVRNGNRHTENTRQEIWARVTEEVSRESERYIL
jgi:hypothetical protein